MHKLPGFEYAIGEALITSNLAAGRRGRGRRGRSSRDYGLETAIADRLASC